MAKSIMIRATKETEGLFDDFHEIIKGGGFNKSEVLRKLITAWVEDNKRFSNKKVVIYK